MYTCYVFDWVLSSKLESAQIYMEHIGRDVLRKIWLRSPWKLQFTWRAGPIKTVPATMLRYQTHYQILSWTALAIYDGALDGPGRCPDATLDATRAIWSPNWNSKNHEKSSPKISPNLNMFWLASKNPKHRGQYGFMNPLWTHADELWEVLGSPMGQPAWAPRTSYSSWAIRSELDLQNAYQICHKST